MKPEPHTAAEIGRMELQITANEQLLNELRDRVDVVVGTPAGVALEIAIEALRRDITAKRLTIIEVLRDTYRSGRVG